MRNNSNRLNRKKRAIDVALTVVTCIAAVLLAARVALSVFYFKVYVVGASMASTLVGAKSEYESGGDYVYAFRSSSPRRGDIVVIKTERKTDHKTRTIIKRVIALGGDVVELKAGELFINGEKQSETYVLAENNTPSDEINSFPESRVPDGCMFCLGDNRNVSNDSRSEDYGFIPVERTVGIVADWSMTCKSSVTAFNTFFEFTLPSAFGLI